MGSHDTAQFRRHLYGETFLPRWAAGAEYTVAYDGEVFNEAMRPLLELIPPERAAEAAARAAEEVDAFRLAVPDAVLGVGQPGRGEVGMGNKRLITILVWGAWSAFCSAMFIYLGANTIRYRDRWPIAGLVGAVIGTVGAMLFTTMVGNRRGIVLTGILFGILQAVAMEFYWPDIK